jgi:hypothetical protein
MTKIDFVNSKRDELLLVTYEMLTDKINLIEGVRRICSLRFLIDDPENQVFLSMRGIDSETDHFPIGDVRSRCSCDYLQRIDTEMIAFLAKAKPDILDACRDIIRMYNY